MKIGSSKSVASITNGAVLLFGGTFDPIHNGHLIIARNVAEKLKLKKIILIPTAQPPHKEKAAVSNANHRLLMAQLAVQGDKLFEVSGCELGRTGPSYTLETIKHFRQVYGAGVQLYWLIGADTIRELPDWYQIDQLVQECTIVSAGRVGYDLSDLSALQTVLDESQIARLKEYILDTPLIEISSTDIRQRVGQGLSISQLVPPMVRDYILRHELYRSQR